MFIHNLFILLDFFGFSDKTPDAQRNVEEAHYQTNECSVLFTRCRTNSRHPTDQSADQIPNQSSDVATNKNRQ
jgi:hypothetical protein